MVFSMLADSLGLSASGFSHGQGLMLIVGAMGMVVGILGRRTLDVYKQTGVILLNTLVLLVILEVLAGGVMWLISRNDESETERALVDERQLKDYYQEVAWGIPYWFEEHDVLTHYLRYRPYTVWGLDPFDGEYLNIAPSGLRQTPNAMCADESYTIFMFGGSTLYGAGAPDWGTIPAYVQNALADENERPVCVMNFGQPGHVITQNLIALMLELQNGHVPDAVIFYNGVNEVIAMIQSGIPNAHHRQKSIAEAYNAIGNDSAVSLQEGITQEVNKTYLMRLYRHFVPENEEEPTEQDYNEAVTRFSPEQVGAAIASYLGTYTVIQALAESYGFEAYFFWQPVIWMTDKPFTSDEQAAREALGTAVPAMYEQIYQAAQQISSVEYPRYFYIADVLDGVAEVLYADRYHLTPEGNQIVAKAILNCIENESC